MNKKILQNVVAPPIVAFKDKAHLINPRVIHNFDMTQAVPSYPTFEKIRQHLRLLLADGDISYYTDVPGLPALRAKIAETHPLSDDIFESHVLVTAGANHAMYAALTLLFNPGEKVMLLEPYYFNYDMAIKMLSLQPVYYPLSGQNGFRLNAKEVIRCAEAEGVRGIILITPNNPTGARYEDVELLKLLEWSSSVEVEILLDETYFRFDPQHLKDERIGKHLETSLNIIGSFSKCFSLTGYRVGYFIGAEQKINEMLKVQDTMIICAPHIAQSAALFGLEECLCEVDEKVAVIARLERILAEECAGLMNFKLASSGAYFAFLRHPFSATDCEGACLSLYENTGILGLPGTIFGESMGSFIRLAFCNLEEENLVSAIHNLKEFDRELTI